jgi:hypothetical protein
MTREERAVNKLVKECIKRKDTEFLAKLILRLQEEYIAIAQLATDGHYKERWTHKQVLDYLTQGGLT